MLVYVWRPSKNYCQVSSLGDSDTEKPRNKNNYYRQKIPTRLSCSPEPICEISNWLCRLRALFCWTIYQGFQITEEQFKWLSADWWICHWSPPRCKTTFIFNLPFKGMYMYVRFQWLAVWRCLGQCHSQGCHGYTLHSPAFRESLASQALPPGSSLLMSLKDLGRQSDTLIS